MSKPTAGIPELVELIQALSEKIDRLEKAGRMPHIPPATMATAQLLTGITKRVDIARHLGVSGKWLRVGPAFAAFRLAEGAIRSRGAVSSRRRSGDDFTETDD